MFASSEKRHAMYKMAARLHGGLEEVMTEGLLSRQLLLLGDDSLHALPHLLNGIVLAQTQAALVGDVVDTAHTLGVLTVDTCTSHASGYSETSDGQSS